MVSISPTSLNKFAKILKFPCSLNSRYGEYQALMSFLTNTGINLLDFIDLSQNEFDSMIERIYTKSKTTLFKDILTHIKHMYSESAEYTTGKNVIRYLLQNLKEETIEGVLPNAFGKCMNGNLYLASGCYPFENSPLLSDILGGKTTEGHNFRHTLNAVGYDGLEEVRPYLTLKMQLSKQGKFILNKLLFQVLMQLIIIMHNLIDGKGEMVTLFQLIMALCLLMPTKKYIIYIENTYRTFTHWK